MPEFIFGFDYEDLDDAEYNAKGGQTNTTVGYFRIEAPSEADAMAWGAILADRYVMLLFRDPSPGRWSTGTHSNGRLMPGSFTSWIEEEDDDDSTLFQEAQSAPLISIGDYPDFGHYRRLLRDDVEL